jgi:hypothetical protein
LVEQLLLRLIAEAGRPERLLVGLLLRLVAEDGLPLRLVVALLLARVHGRQSVVVLFRLRLARRVVEAEPSSVEPGQSALFLPAGQHRLHARIGQVAVALVGRVPIPGRVHVEALRGEVGVQGVALLVILGLNAAHNRVLDLGALGAVVLGAHHRHRAAGLEVGPHGAAAVEAGLRSARIAAGRSGCRRSRCPASARSR